MEIKLKSNQPLFTKSYYECEIDNHKCWYVHDSFDNTGQITWFEKAVNIPYNLRLHKNQISIIKEIQQKLGL
jgi:hypothetical protein